MKRFSTALLIAASTLAVLSSSAFACGPYGGTPSPVVVASELPEYDRQAVLTGTWTTNWGPVTLKQSGKRVVGTYAGPYTGRIKGIVDADGILRFVWYQDNGQRGKGTFRIGLDGSLIGTWGLGPSETDGGAWSSVKQASQPSL